MVCIRSAGDFFTTDIASFFIALITVSGQEALLKFLYLVLFWNVLKVDDIFKLLVLGNNFILIFHRLTLRFIKPLPHRSRENYENFFLFISSEIMRHPLISHFFLIDILDVFELSFVRVAFGLFDGFSIKLLFFCNFILHC